MTENKDDNSDDAKRKPLTLSRKGTATVKQSFSHGRTKSVVVEKKKRRIVVPGKSPAQTAKPSKAADTSGLSEAELEARSRALKAREDAERKRKEQAEAEAKARAEREAQQKKKREEEKRVQDEIETQKRLEEEAKAAKEAKEIASKAKEEAAKKPAGKDKAAPVDPAEIEAAEIRAERSAERKDRRDDEDTLGELGGRVKKSRKEEAKPSSRTRGEPKRRQGKLTITSILDDDDGQRQRSLASVRRARERERERRLGGDGQDSEKKSREVVVPETITIQELANRMTERAADVVKYLMKQGEMLRANEVIDADMAELIVEEFGHTIKRVSEADVEVGLVGQEDDPATLKSRAPVIAVMGHVDHGKTSLLDALRSTDVAGGEAGGITQHIGAYQVKLKGGEKLTFLDTPGHAAFSAMRARGATATDIVILVVAADDGVMPQTIEAINHARAAETPIIVAVNKCDKEDADPNKVLTDLLQHEVIVESMGGEVQAINVSAIKKTGLDELTEAIALQAEILELKANPDRSAEGIIIESKLDKGKGPVATLLVQRGDLKRGDIVVAGTEWGKIRALNDERGQQLKDAGPSVPVEVLGLSGAPDPGEAFVVVENEARAREVTEYRERLVREKAGIGAGRASLEQMLTKLKDGSGLQEMPVVVKADVLGSAEAIQGSLDKISTDEVRARVIHQGVGGIAESDVLLANASGAPILAFNVRANKQARDLAEAEGVEIRYYSIIYDLLDDIKDTLSGMLAPEKRETFIGYAKILQVFNISKLGNVAGCEVTEGVVKRGCGVRLLRDDIVIHEGELSTLRRFKDEVEEVRNGTECGMGFKNYHDLKEGDMIECFDVEMIERKLD